jgi:hypothetical protein
MSFIVKGRVGKERVYFLFHRILPIYITVSLVKFVSFFDNARYFDSKLENRAFVLYKSPRARCSECNFVAIALSLFPSRTTKQVMCQSIYRKVNGIIFDDHFKWFIC